MTLLAWVSASRSMPPGRSTRMRTTSRVISTSHSSRPREANAGPATSRTLSTDPITTSSSYSDRFIEGKQKRGHPAQRRCGPRQQPPLRAVTPSIATPPESPAGQRSESGGKYTVKEAGRSEASRARRCRRGDEQGVGSIQAASRHLLDKPRRGKLRRSEPTQVQRSESGQAEPQVSVLPRAGRPARRAFGTALEHPPTGRGVRRTLVHFRRKHLEDESPRAAEALAPNAAGTSRTRT